VKKKKGARVKKKHETAKSTFREMGGGEKGGTAGGGSRSGLEARQKSLKEKSQSLIGKTVEGNTKVSRKKTKTGGKGGKKEKRKGVSAKKQEYERIEGKAFWNGKPTT